MAPAQMYSGVVVPSSTARTHKRNPLKHFDLRTLNILEIRVYADLSKSMTKEEALQILINNVEGDYSQLSHQLAEVANMQESQI